MSGEKRPGRLCVLVPLDGGLSTIRVNTELTSPRRTRTDHRAECPGLSHGGSGRGHGCNQRFLVVDSVVQLGLHAGPARLRAHQHLQRAAPHAQLHHGQQPAYASESPPPLKPHICKSSVKYLWNRFF